MSTRSTVAYVEHNSTVIHLYYDCIEGTRILYLEVVGAQSVGASAEVIQMAKGATVMQRASIGLTLDAFRAFLPEAARKIAALENDPGMGN